MRVLLIGANGDIGKVAYDALSVENSIVTAGRSSGDVQVDISDPASVSAMYKEVGHVDAVVSAAGDAHFASLEQQTRETFMVGLTHKVMGQVNLVLQGMEHISVAGSFTCLLYTSPSPRD